MLSVNVSADANLPITVQELKETSVRILNPEQTSGGTGSIYRSSKNYSYILTNKHICRLIEQGGVVDYKGEQYPVTHYKKFPHHDLCLIRIASNLGVNLKISDQISRPSDKTVVSGHPSLLPHIATNGHLSERREINLMVGIKECTEADLKNDVLMCIFFGGMPVIKSFDSQIISNLIKPGNSGSAVFNKKGEVIGVVFAGTGRDFSYGFIVPQIHLFYFLENLDKFDWVKTGTPVDDEGMSERFFNLEKCQQTVLMTEKFKKVKQLCKIIADNMIWRK
jgi:S1-C subfamily serine protease